MTGLSLCGALGKLRGDGSRWFNDDDHLGQVGDFMEELSPQLGNYECRGSGQLVA